MTESEGGSHDRLIHRTVLFVVDATCSFVSSGSYKFRHEAIRETSRYLAVAVARLLVYVVRNGSDNVHLRCGYRVVCDQPSMGPTLSKCSPLKPPGAQFIESLCADFQEVALKDSEECVARFPRDIDAILETTIETLTGNVSECVPNGSRHRPILFFFSRIPATLTELQSFLSLQSKKLNDTPEVKSENLPSFQNCAPNASSDVVPGDDENVGDICPRQEQTSTSGRRDIGESVKTLLKNAGVMQNAFHVLKTGGFLFRWIDSGTRREDSRASFDAPVFNAFQNWLVAQDLDVKTMFMYSLMSERATISFGAVAASLGLDQVDDGCVNDQSMQTSDQTNERIASVLLDSEALFEALLTATVSQKSLAAGQFQFLTADSSINGAKHARTTIVPRCTLPIIDLNAMGPVSDDLTTLPIFCLKPRSRLPEGCDACCCAGGSISPCNADQSVKNRNRGVASFAGLMIYLAHSQLALVADLCMMVDEHKESCQSQTFLCAIIPATPLSAQVRLLGNGIESLSLFRECPTDWHMMDVLSTSKDELSPTSPQMFTANSCSRTKIKLNRAVSLSARSFETFIGASTSCMTIPRFLDDPDDELLSRTFAETAMETTHDFISAACESAVPDEYELQENGLANSAHMQSSLESLDASLTFSPSSQSAQISDAEKLLSSMRFSKFTDLPTEYVSEQKFSCRNTGSLRSDLCAASKSDRGTMVANTELGMPGSREASSSETVARGVSDNASTANDLKDRESCSIDEFNAKMHRAAQTETCLEKKSKNVLQTISVLENSKEQVRQEEVASIFHLLNEVLASCRMYEQEKQVIKSLLDDPKSVCEQIKSACAMLQAPSIERNSQDAQHLHRNFLGSLLRGFLQICLHILKQTWSMQKKATSSDSRSSLAKRLRHVLQILTAIQLQSQLVNRHLGNESFLDSVFNSFFDAVLIPQRNNEALSTILTEVWRLHDRDPTSYSRKRNSNEHAVDIVPAAKRARIKRQNSTTPTDKNRVSISTDPCCIMQQSLSSTNPLNRELLNQQPLRMRPTISAHRKSVPHHGVERPSVKSFHSKKSSNVGDAVILAPATPRRMLKTARTEAGEPPKTQCQEISATGSRRRENTEQDHVDEVVGTP